MTVIACKDGIIAADSGVWHDKLCFAIAPKLRRLSDGSIIGAAGWQPAIERGVAWLERGAAEDDRPRDVEDTTDLDCIVLKPNGAIWCLCRHFEFYPTFQDVMAAGAHDEFLYGAMAAGLSAEAAIELALRYCSTARGPVQIMRLE